MSRGEVEEHGAMNLTDKSARVEVEPAPTADEMAALLTVLHHRHHREIAQPAKAPSLWAVAARREGLRGMLEVKPGGWRRASRLDR